MKHVLIFTMLLSTCFAFCQSSESDQVKATIDRFFEGFHKQDSTLILSTVEKDIKMQSIGKDRIGKVLLKTEPFHDFLKSIVSIPKDRKFQEILLEYKIQVDGDMAHVWTPYQFWLDEKLSHCGVNSFQLYKSEGVWKIIYLVDTRHQDCDS